jgi:diketogulonate reductase-like aldo/keto reductase
MSISFLKSTIQLNNGLSMPRIHLGVYQASGRQVKDAVKWALQAGYRAVDSAEVYGNEKEAGIAILNFLKSESSLSRKDIWFTTKLWNNTSYNATRASITNSIQRSGLGYLDLYLLHSPYPGKDKRLECWRAIEDAILAGEVRAGGVSNWSVKHVIHSCSVPPKRTNCRLKLRELLDSKPRIVPAVNQIEVHPFNTRTDITTFCQENGIVVEAYAPLARALRMKNPTIVRLSTKYKVSPAQLLVRWSLQKGYVPLPKSVHEERIITNTQVDDFIIHDDDVATLDGLDEYLVTDWDPTTAD